MSAFDRPYLECLIRWLLFFLKCRCGSEWSPQRSTSTPDNRLQFLCFIRHPPFLILIFPLGESRLASFFLLSKDSPVKFNFAFLEGVHRNQPPLRRLFNTLDTVIPIKEWGSRVKYHFEVAGLLLLFFLVFDPGRRLVGKFVKHLFLFFKE